MAGMKRTPKTKKVRVPSGYIVEDFDKDSGGYGNLMEERLTAAEAIRHFCVECQGGHYFDWRNGDGTVIKKSVSSEPVETCSSTTCWLFPNRMGHRAPARATKKEAIPAGV